MRGHAVGRLPVSHLIVWSDGEVLVPIRYWDDEGDDVAPADCTMVIVVRDFVYVKLQLGDLDPIILH